jgi:hypothetical protein
MPNNQKNNLKQKQIHKSFVQQKKKHNKTFLGDENTEIKKKMKKNK